jgi:anti-sigma factor RsiW
MSSLRKQLSCQELVELVTDYFEGALSRRDRKRFERHIRGCDACTAYLEQIRLTIEVSGKLTGESLEPQVRDELLEAFRGWKQQRA